MDAAVDAAGALAANIAFTTSGALSEIVDKKVIAVLRDGRKYVGVLRSYDQFANLVLQDTVERVYVGQQYGEIPLGVYLVRGENVVLLGEVDLEREDEVPPQIAAPFPPGQFTEKELDKMRRAETEARQARHVADAAVLKHTHAFAEHGDEGDQY